MTKRIFKTRNSQLAQKICSWFKMYRNEDLSFGAILDKYCEIGMSRERVAKFLMEMKDKTGKETLGKQIQIKDTPLWEAWKAEIAQGRCDSFKFHSKFVGNPHHGNRGKTKKLPKRTSNQLITVKYTCDNCGDEHEGEIKTAGAPKYLLALKAYRCPACGKFASCSGEIEVDGKIITKRIVDNTEILITKGELVHG